MHYFGNFPLSVEREAHTETVNAAVEIDFYIQFDFGGAGETVGRAR